MASHATMQHELYDMLLDYADLVVEVEEVNIGQNWTMCRAGTTGLAATRPLSGGVPSWEGTLRGRQLGQLSHWLLDWDHSRAAIGLSAVNAALNREADLVTARGAFFKGNEAFHHSIDWFIPLLRGKRVALVGRQHDAFSQADVDWQHFYSAEGGIHPACQSELPQCDWVFINANTIADKSLPYLLEYSRDSRVVLYGAAVPWLDNWQHFGVDYLLGCEVDSVDHLQSAVTEGQDVEQSAAALHFRLINLHPELVRMPTNRQPSLRSVATA